MKIPIKYLVRWWLGEATSSRHKVEPQETGTVGGRTMWIVATLPVMLVAKGQVSS